MRITGGKGARIVFDPVGGPYVDTLAQATGAGRCALHLWRPERPADDASALAGGSQESQHSWLGRLNDLEFPGPVRAREGPGSCAGSLTGTSSR